MHEDTKHIFSNFGSGTLVGAPTYWSKYCTFNPLTLFKELIVLQDKGIKPTMYINKQCPVITPYDIDHTQSSKQYKDNGTCGMGHGATIERESKGYSLLAGDLLHPSILSIKLDMIECYYREFTRKLYKDEFIKVMKYFFDNHIFFVDDMSTLAYDNLVFEGSQGLLLDQNYGFFPHVTRSNTGTKNILEMGYEPYVYLVTRAFQTRHGNGPMTNESIPNNIVPNPHETCVPNGMQGSFRRSLLDLDLLKYGMERDEYIRTTNKKTLVITCLDLVQNEFRYTINGEIVNHTNQKDFVNGISSYLGIKDVIEVSSPYGFKEVTTTLDYKTLGKDAYKQVTW